MGYECHPGSARVAKSAAVAAALSLESRLECGRLIPGRAMGGSITLVLSWARCSRRREGGERPSKVIMRGHVQADVDKEGLGPPLHPRHEANRRPITRRPAPRVSPNTGAATKRGRPSVSIPHRRRTTLVNRPTHYGRALEALRARRKLAMPRAGWSIPSCCCIETLKAEAVPVGPARRWRSANSRWKTSLRGG